MSDRRLACVVRDSDAGVHVSDVLPLELGDTAKTKFNESSLGRQRSKRLPARVPARPLAIR